jgi:hypothetical protein
MPPQQRQRPSDVAGRRLDFGSHAPLRSSIPMLLMQQCR